ncbi:MAG: hypothetical protein JXR76_31420 [Deltaproteobacteria bacterium]|nr:hypothetical protein [Deltaproteobacteria bacterium]
MPKTREMVLICSGNAGQLRWKLDFQRVVKDSGSMMLGREVKKIIFFAVLAMTLTMPMVSMAQSSLDGRLVGTEKQGDARMLAMGGALRASNSNTSAVYLNPAAMGMAHVYHLNVKYQYTGLDKLHNGGLAIVDSITHHILSAGVSLDYLRAAREDSDFKSLDIRLAGAVNIREVFFVGVTGRFLRVAHDVESGSVGPNRLPALPKNGDAMQASGLTLDVGLAAKLGDIVSIGLTASNISDTGSLYAPIELGGGIAALIKNIWLLELDLIADFTSYEKTEMALQLGTEFILKQQFSFRGGFDREFHFDVSSYSLGFGYATTRFAVDLGFKQDIEYIERFRIALGFRFFIG